MRYKFYLYDKDNSARLAVLRNVVDAHLDQDISGKDDLELTLAMYDDTARRIFDVTGDADGSEAILLTNQKWIRLIDLDSTAAGFGFYLNGGEYTRSYVIREIEKSRSAQGELLVKIKAEGYAFKFLDKIVNLVADFSNITAGIFLDRMLVGTGLTLGTNQIPTTELRTLRVEFPNVIELLNLVVDTWDTAVSGNQKRFFWRINESNNTVDFLREDTYGSTLVPKVSPSRSLLELSKGFSSRRMVNRIFANTEDGGSLIESQRTWYRDTIVGPDVTTVGNTDSLTLNGYGDTSNKLAARSYVTLAVRTEVVWSSAGDADFVISAELQTSGGTTRARFDKSVHHAGSGTTEVIVTDIVLEVLEYTDAEKLVLKFESFTINSGTVTSKRIYISSAPGTSFGIWYWTAPNLDYVDGANQATYGIIEGGLKDERLNLMAHNLISDYKKITGTRASPTVTNLEINSDFTGTYTSGVCAGWEKDIGATATQNTDKQFIIHGTSSQKLVTGSNNRGIHNLDSFPLRKRFVYFFLLNIYVEVGRVHIKLTNQFTSANDIDYTTTGNGFLQLFGFLDFLSAGLPSGDNEYKWDIKGDQASGGTHTFYVDSILTCVADAERPFTRKSIADDLRNKAVAEMKLKENPVNTLGVGLANLGDLEPNLQSADRFVIGDYIPIDDKHLNVSGNLRVVSKKMDLFHPEKTELEVEVHPDNLPDAIFRTLGRPEFIKVRS